MINKKSDTQIKNLFDSAEYFMNKELLQLHNSISKKIKAPKTFKKVFFDSADYFMELNAKDN